MADEDLMEEIRGQMIKMAREALHDEALMAECRYAAAEALRDDDVRDAIRVAARDVVDDQDVTGGAGYRAFELPGRGTAASWIFRGDDGSRAG